MPIIKINEEVKHKFAEIVSKITNAPLLAIPVFFILNYILLDGLDFVIITFICLLFGTILPIALIILWIKRIKKIKNENAEYDLSDKNDRTIPLIFAIISYLIGAIVLYFLNAPLITIGLMFCYFSNTLIVFFITLFWKISIHSMGVAGPTTALIYAIGPIGSIYALILPIVMWSRTYLKRHTVPQVIMGASLGFILTAVQLWILFNVIYDIPTDIYSFLWIIFAFIGPSIVLSVSGVLNRRGMHDGYTRKIFHFVAFISIAGFIKYAPPNIPLIFIAVGTIYILVACFSNKGFLWFDGISRKSDSPHEKLYVILPMVSTILGLGVSWTIFGHPFVEIGMLCVAVGDAIAEPIGVKWGKHKFKVYSLTSKTSERSLEGSLSVFFACALIIFFTTNNITPSLLIGFVIAIIEAISPRGTDNFTVLVGASVGLWLMGINN